MPISCWIRQERPVLRSLAAMSCWGLMSLLGIGHATTALWAQGVTEQLVTSKATPVLWPKTTPEREGMNSTELVKLFDQVRQEKIDVNSIVILRNGHLVLESYFASFKPGEVHDLASVTKSITGILTGIALDKGFLKDVRQPVIGFFPERSPAHLDARKRKLTLEHLLTMTSGLCRNSEEGEEQPAKMGQSLDGLQYMLDLPLVEEPGRKFVYSSLAPHLLSAILTRTTGRNLLGFARANLFDPLGIHEVRWEEDHLGNSHGWGDLCLTPVDLAKIGCLLLNGGRWGQTQIVSSNWIQKSMQPQIHEDAGTAYGYLWWIPLGNPGLVEARGRGGQRLYIWPQKQLVVVIAGNGGYLLGGIAEHIKRAVASDLPLPEDARAQSILAARVAEAARPSPPKAVLPLPAQAMEISGITYAMETNPLGLASFAITFSQGPEAQIKLTFLDHNSKKPEDWTLGVGLDDAYRKSGSLRYGLPAWAKGGWTSPSEFAFMINEPANNRLFRFSIRFEGTALVMKVSERTGLVEDTTIKGHSTRGSMP